MTQNTGIGNVSASDYGDWFDAVRGGYANMLREMAEANPHVLALTNFNGGTALHEAVAEGKVEIAALLLQLGANVNAEDENGGTPLHAAALLGDNALMNALVKMLVDKGAQLEARQGDNISTPLHCAAYRGNVEAVKLLLDAGADIHARDGRGKNALQVAQGWKRAGVAKFLEHEMSLRAFAEEARILTDGLPRDIKVGHHITLHHKREKGP